MKLEDLKKLPHIKKIEENDEMITLFCENGYYITSFNKDDDDIFKYDGGEGITAPILDEYPDYYIIEEAEHIVYVSKIEELLEKLLVDNDLLN